MSHEDNNPSHTSLGILVGGIVATVENPNNFDNFTDGSGNFQQFLPYFQTTAEGLFCVNVSLESAGISGVKDGANVTIQLIFDGGDGKLYQVRTRFLSPCSLLTPHSLYENPALLLVN